MAPNRWEQSAVTRIQKARHARNVNARRVYRTRTQLVAKLPDNAETVIVSSAMGLPGASAAASEEEKELERVKLSSSIRQENRKEGQVRDEGESAEEDKESGRNKERTGESECDSEGNPDNNNKLDKHSRKNGTGELLSGTADKGYGVSTKNNNNNNRNPFQKEMREREAAQLAREKERARWQAEEAARKRKQAEARRKRKKASKVHRSKTRRGQPKLKHQVGALLEQVTKAMDK